MRRSLYQHSDWISGALLALIGCFVLMALWMALNAIFGAELPGARQIVGLFGLGQIIVFCINFSSWLNAP